MPEPALRPRVVLHPVHPPGLADVLAPPEGVELLTPDADGVLEAIADGAEGLITYQWDDAFLDHGIRWIQAASAGTDQFPIDRITERGAVLTSARGAHSPAVADHAVALLLALVRRMAPAIRRSVDREWRPEMAFETEQMTVGIVGLGSIGEAIARRLRGFDMTVIGCKRDPHTHDGNVDRVVGADEMDSVFADSDAVVLVLPHTSDTEGIVGRAQLEALGSGWLVNVGRGALVDEEALVDALRAGSLRGAGLDVTAVEPLPDDSPLWDMDDVIVTPHMAWGSDRLNQRLVEIIRANVAAFLGEAEWLNQVTP